MNHEYTRIIQKIRIFRLTLRKLVRSFVLHWNSDGPKLANRILDRFDYERPQTSFPRKRESTSVPVLKKTGSLLSQGRRRRSSNCYKFFMIPVSKTYRFCILTTVFFTAVLLQAQTPEPTVADLPYGHHERQVLDFWKAKSDSPAPLVVFIHGGGFQALDKSRITLRFVREFLDAGISVAAFNYRFVQTHPFPACFEDVRYALQFLRSKAGAWNIDSDKIGAYGGSAGAMMSLWLGFHDDMADADSADPIARQSTRLYAVAAQGGQITFDRHWMEQSIPGNMIHNNPAFIRLFGVQQITDLDRPDILRWVRELSPIYHLTADDPPVYMEYAMAPDAPVPTDPQQLKPWALHHVIFGLTLQVRMQALGIESSLQYPGATPGYHSIPHYFKVKFGKASL